MQMTISLIGRNKQLVDGSISNPQKRTRCRDEIN